MGQIQKSMDSLIQAGVIAPLGKALKTSTEETIKLKEEAIVAEQAKTKAAEKTIQEKEAMIKAIEEEGSTDYLKDPTIFREMGELHGHEIVFRDEYDEARAELADIRQQLQQRSIKEQRQRRKAGLQRAMGRKRGKR